MRHTDQDGATHKGKTKMSRNYPETIPADYAKSDKLQDAYRRGWSHGHGLACHNVPRIGDKLWTDDSGHIVVDAENIREVHQSLCFSAESSSRDFSPFEFTAHEFNSADEEGEEGDTEALWEAFETGTNDAIFADLSEYSDDDYGLND